MWDYVGRHEGILAGRWGVPPPGGKTRQPVRTRINIGVCAGPTRQVNPSGELADPSGKLETGRGCGVFDSAGRASPFGSGDVTAPGGRGDCALGGFRNLRALFHLWSAGVTMLLLRPGTGALRARSGVGLGGWSRRVLGT